MVNVINFELTDEQWANICRHMCLPKEVHEGMRQEINNVSSIYLTLIRIKPRATNSDIKKEIRTIEETLGKVIDLFEGLSVEAEHELLHPDHIGGHISTTPRLDGSARLDHHKRTLLQLHRWVSSVHSGIEKQPTGKNPEHFRSFVADVARIFQRHAIYKVFSQQAGRYKYVSAIMEAVEPDCPHSSDNAVNSLSPWLV